MTRLARTTPASAATTSDLQGQVHRTEAPEKGSSQETAAPQCPGAQGRSAGRRSARLAARENHESTQYDQRRRDVDRGTAPAGSPGRHDDDGGTDDIRQGQQEREDDRRDARQTMTA